MKVNDYQVTRQANKHNISLAVEFSPQSEVLEQNKLSTALVLVTLENGMLMNSELVDPDTASKYQLNDAQEDEIINFIKNNLTAQDFM